MRAATQGTFLIGGGRPSRKIRVLDNDLYNVGMQIGYDAPHNEDCEIRNNVIVNGGLQINKFKKAVNEGNMVLGKNDARPAGVSRTTLRKDPYNPNRATIAVFNWEKKGKVSLGRAVLDGFCKTGDRLRVLSPRDFYGKPLAEAVFSGEPIELPIEGEFAAFVVVKETTN